MSTRLTRVRSLRSSSREEDINNTTHHHLDLDDDEELALGTGEAYRAQMRDLWDDLDPTRQDYPESWFEKLGTEFGEDLPVEVLRQFVLSDRTLADLERPADYKGYFVNWCRNELRKQTTRSTDPAAADEEEEETDLEALYRAERQAMDEEEEVDLEPPSAPLEHAEETERLLAGLQTRIRPQSFDGWFTGAVVCASSAAACTLAVQDPHWVAEYYAGLLQEVAGKPVAVVSWSQVAEGQPELAGPVKLNGG